MLEAVPKGPFSPDFHMREDGAEVAYLDRSAWRERAEVEVEGRRCRLFREGMARGAFVLECEGERLAEADKPSVFRSAFEVRAAGRRFQLVRPSMWRREFQLLEGGVPVGSVRPLGWFSKRSAVDLPPTLSLPVRVFIFWLVALIWTRDEAAAAGG